MHPGWAETGRARPGKAPAAQGGRHDCRKDAPAGTPAQTVSTTPAPAAQTAQAPQQEEADAPLSPLPYPPLTELAGLPAWEAFLHAPDPRGLSLALCLEGDCTLATADGQCCRLALGGDLLSPGVDPAEALRALAPALLAGPVVVHDGKKLLHTLRRHGLPLPESFHWDTMLGAYVLNPQEKSYALGALLGGLPADARGLMSLFRWQEKRTRRDGVEKLLKEVELPLSHVLFRMEEAGFTVDGDALRALGQGYTAEIEACREQVYQAAGVRDFNLNSTQQLGEVLFDRLQLPHGKKTQKGYSTSAEVLENLRDIAPEIIDPLLRYRQLTKLNGTYIEGLLRLMGPEGRIHSTFDQVATATGRISSSEPNLQNIPVRTAQGREIRRAFVPRKGWVLLDADYSQIELRLMAHFSGDKALVEAFRTGQDVHARTASEIFDVPLSEVTPTLRSRAKAVNFGLIYGISGFGLARNTGVTQKEAKEFIARYFAKYPGVKRFMDEAVRLGQERGYAETLLGRRRYLPELNSSRNVIREFGRRAAMNTPVQGTAADIIKLAMVRVDEAPAPGEHAGHADFAGARRAAHRVPARGGGARRGAFAGMHGAGDDPLRAPGRRGASGRQLVRNQMSPKMPRRGTVPRRGRFCMFRESRWAGLQTDPRVRPVLSVPSVSFQDRCAPGKAKAAPPWHRLRYKAPGRHCKDCSTPPALRTRGEPHPRRGKPLHSCPGCLCESPERPLPAPHHRPKVLNITFGYVTGIANWWTLDREIPNFCGKAHSCVERQINFWHVIDHHKVLVCQLYQTDIIVLQGHLPGAVLR